MSNTHQIITALVTPFNQDGSINYDELEQLTNHLIQHGSDGFVIGGTTGEGPNLSHDEKINLFSKFVEIVDGRAKIIAGTGTNSTSDTVNFTKEVAQINGIDAGLVVVPYYNKPDQAGMVAHFTAVAEASDLPLIIYNIPGRTGVTMANETIVKLAHQQGIIGVKQCTNLDDLSYLVDHTQDLDFDVYTGEDGQLLSGAKVGVKGVISVASHLFGDQMQTVTDLFDQGDIKSAAELQDQLTPKMTALFSHPSPAPVKDALNRSGFEVGEPKLPILKLNSQQSDELHEILAQGVSDND
ncbi:dihydrodipicolinate synthase [Pediococcus argentinicus]|uniref:4-hydroxy-tetrahydrodipicolinate synthase n=2 Tax=Pediococcus argentinicus TaxID=480391 RepID=A0A0R2N893_9LACO|nr:4-hydroxy-tetrahydrodipicolinate synthase [Pediococcus argentinicus]KRO22049.1 dihydrodipicolinate synthase [Pediococcus argentinicus]NKZ23080.1 4-hydroxy-tetrahydrodipicolinate synthase [Pediococcus argentinicus]GEP20217.1 4-hydroxy-tetrahydrodipicolinate synthase [Pediococcus argentinicus]